MNRVRTCVVGVGRVGFQHARLLSQLPGSRLVGVCDADAARGETVAAQLGTRHLPDAAELLARADAAVVAVPTGDHYRVARAALEAGCHVLVEKPLAATLEEADLLIGLAEERGLSLGVGHVERFNGVLRRCAPLLERPRFVESLRLSPFQPRGTDVTVVLDLMIHDIDLVLGLVGSRVVSLHAVGVAVISGSVDIANARLIFENGAVADITASRVSAERKRRLRVFQPTGYVSLDLIAGRGEFLRRRADAPAEAVEVFPESVAAEPGAGQGGTEDDVPQGLGRLLERVPLAADGEEPLKLELEALLRAARGQVSDLVSAREGRAALEVALAITREIEEFAHVVDEDP